VTLQLNVVRDHWRSHVLQVLSESDRVVPVVKGNGYGFGRANLITELTNIRVRPTDVIAVGTVHELDLSTREALASAGATAIVLTPTLVAPSTNEMILTVGSSAHIAALKNWDGQVVIKLVSAMHRYGGDVSLIDEATAAGLQVRGVSIHPPLPGYGQRASTQSAHITDWLASVPPECEVWVSHLSADEFHQLPLSHHYRHRLGTRLWHGDKSMLTLTAEVLDTRPVEAGIEVGYRQILTPTAGTLVMIGAGSAHGVRTLPNGLSPFHYAAQRMDLIEPPHMHTSMVFIPSGRRVPEVGEQVDVQHPLTQVSVDHITWS
jgi:alanine racemase